MAMDSHVGDDDDDDDGRRGCSDVCKSRESTSLEWLTIKAGNLLQRLREMVEVGMMMMVMVVVRKMVVVMCQQKQGLYCKQGF